MTVRDDAKELLEAIYETDQEESLNKRAPLTNVDLEETTELDGEQLERAARYLQESECINAVFLKGGYFTVKRILKKGIDVIENNKSL